MLHLNFFSTTNDHFTGFSKGTIVAAYALKSCSHIIQPILGVFLSAMFQSPHPCNKQDNWPNKSPIMTFTYQDTAVTATSASFS
jgi:hypothetical protein